MTSSMEPKDTDPKRGLGRHYRAVRVALMSVAVFVGAAFVLIVIGEAIILGARLGDAEDMAFGANFSDQYATGLGLDWKQVYVAMLDDLHVRLIRLPAYWDDIEPTPGVYDFSTVDWQIQEASKRDAKVLVAMGVKLPRWPECHAPAWIGSMDAAEVRRQRMAMIDAVVRRYQDDSTVIGWQVENEPLFQFGSNCRKLTAEELQAEVAEVHALDRRPVVLQDAGEFSTWQATAKFADTLGVSLYRIVWDKRFGYIHWPALAYIYRIRAALAMRHVDRVIVTELQAEPWVTEEITKVPIGQQVAQMGPNEIKSTVAFARQIGFSEAYFWGVEWWYWMRTQGHPELWDTARALIAGSRHVAFQKP